MGERMRYVPEGLIDPDPVVEPSPVVEPVETTSSSSDGVVSTSSTTGGGGSTTGLPRIGVRGWLRWTWRQLTSMRVALLLLMLLAVAAVPGSVLPQRGQSPAAVLQYLRDHPTSGEWLDRLGFFDAFTSPWFSAIYLLLFVSLVGCILPRAAQHARNLRGRPPRTPARFTRFPAQASGTSSASPDDVATAVAAVLRRGRVFRVDVGAEEARGERPATRTVAAERGYLRESGNLVFHLALLGLLVSVAAGQLFHYRGQAIITEGRGFANAVVDYDTFDKGAWFRPESLSPFSLTLDAFTSEFASDTVAFAQARDFTAFVTVTAAGGVGQSEHTIKVNRPLTVDGAKIYLQGNGFAPEVTVRDASGEIAFAGRVPFIPEDSVYTSRGVIKVPDVAPGLEQIGLTGYFLPTAVIDDDGSARSVFPQPDNPLLVLQVWTGDLGLDDGVPQNVYRLDTANMTAAGDDSGSRAQVIVAPGETVDLPDGLGTLTLGADVPRYIALDLRYDPSLAWVLTFALLGLAGLGVSLFTPRRRVWLRAWPLPDGGTRVELAGLARGDDAGLQGEVDRALAAVPGLTPDEGTPTGPDHPAPDDSAPGAPPRVAHTQEDPR
ncbi:ResB family protein [Xylanimonas cellulosilytica DSM 15894]|uniref:ResB family protein n=1 Tax=Xylanimonas cellulosilytica (strain DSM 15894 / JCM 12276 / CECT 5975 / KCTC 9989 / LMG 20990 / NBRC 107835 / XIL07) TaxID=446471 RepID=D1BVY2_XYLCX|nr:cytochrome c biogenesis protein ResB [Xylanimonas cellulosilytica]ACZ29485.1 ResB family protein [Xylanimonas cellulosilytica DSM 15894]